MRKGEKWREKALIDLLLLQLEILSDGCRLCINIVDQ